MSSITDEVNSSRSFLETLTDWIRSGRMSREWYEKIKHYNLSDVFSITVEDWITKQIKKGNYAWEEDMLVVND